MLTFLVTELFNKQDHGRRTGDSAISLRHSTIEPVAELNRSATLDTMRGLAILAAHYTVAAL